MNVNKIMKEYWYIWLIGIVILSVISRGFGTENVTGSVIINLHTLKDGYEVENPSQERINLTIITENKTKITILDAKAKYLIQEKNFEAIGRRYEN